MYYICAPNHQFHMIRNFFLPGLLALSLSAPAQGQEVAAVANSGRGLIIAPALSLGASQLRGSDADMFNSGFAVQPVLAAGYMVNTHFGVFGGLAYTNNSYKYTYQDPGYNAMIKLRHNLKYLEIPVYARIVSSKADRIGFVADAGINIGFLLSSKATVKMTDIASGASYTVSTKIKDEINKMAASAYVFLGAKFPVAPAVSLLAGVDYQYTFTSAWKESVLNGKFSRYGFKIAAAIQLPH